MQLTTLLRKPECSVSFSIGKRINRICSALFLGPFPLTDIVSARTISAPVHTAPYVPGTTPATYVPTLRTAHMDVFSLARLLCTNAVKSTTTVVNAATCHNPGHYLPICAQMCVSAEFWTSPLRRQQKLISVVNPRRERGSCVSVTDSL